MSVDLLFPNEWQVRGAQRKVLAALYRSPGGALSHADLIALTCPAAKPESQTVISRRHIRELRVKLNPLGVIINARWGEGYEMPAASRVIIRNAIDKRLAP
jgi:Transcriptional regulatory protein, C terminal